MQIIGLADHIIEFFRGRPRGDDDFYFIFQALQTLFSMRQKYLV